MASKTLFDAIIIGGGPAGLNTALGLCRQSRKCLVISHKVFRNDGIEASHAVLGHDHVHPQTILAKAREQIARYGTTSYAEADIESAQQQPLPEWNGHKGFLVKSKTGESWLGKVLVLATGVKDIPPDIQGYKENWPRNIYQCLFCDGWERRKSEKAILSFPTMNQTASQMASMALGLDTSKNADGSAKVTILSNGPFDVNDPSLDPAIVKQAKAVMARGVKIDQRKVISLEPAPESEEGVYVHLQDETGTEERVLFGFLVHKPPTELNAQHLIDGLGVETEKGVNGNIIKVVPPFQGTNVPGVYAVGDNATSLTHVTTAMLSGVSAAGGIVHYLNGLDDEDALKALES